MSAQELNRDERLRLVNERMLSAEKLRQLLEDARFLHEEVHRYRKVLEEIRLHAEPSVNLSSHNNIQTIALIRRIAIDALWETD